MKYSSRMIWVMMVITLLLPMRQVFATPAEPVSDIRILIDVSGSMKKNDPNNLRAPALRLLVGLLPNDAKAGTWTFGKYVNMLVPYRDVNEAWKLEAELQSKNIHSRGLFTNIEQALNKATANQKKADPRFKRSVILLSDGLVDVSSDSEISKKSRQRILDVIVPRLKKNHVAVHTIALSDSADHRLLRAISLATDGWYEQVDNADQLQRVFLHLFEKAATRDTVPLLDNHFKIDDSVSEMTLLVFRRPGSKESQLLLPDQSVISIKNAPNNVRWHSEGNYDLVTVEKPLSGEWQIDADVDPDNRVMVVTDLKLKTTELPNNIVVGESFDFDISLTEINKVIERQDFLKLVDAKLKEESETADPIERSLNADQKKGLYRTHVGDNFKPGRNDVVITMKSATFERQRRQSINVVETPFDIKVERLKEEATRTHRLTMIPDADLIKTDKINIAAMLTAEDGSEWSYEVMKTTGNEWQLTLAELHPGELYTLALQVSGETLKGRPLFLQPALIHLRDNLANKSTNTVEEPAVEEQAVVEPEMVEPVIEDQSEQQQDITLEDTIPDPIIDEMGEDVGEALPEVGNEEVLGLPYEIEKSEPNNAEAGMSPAIKLAIGNGLILLMIGVGIFLWRRKSANSTNPGEQL